MDILTRYQRQKKEEAGRSSPINSFDFTQKQVSDAAGRFFVDIDSAFAPPQQGSPEAIQSIQNVVQRRLSAAEDIQESDPPQTQSPTETTRPPK